MLLLNLLMKLVKPFLFFLSADLGFVTPWWGTGSSSEGGSRKLDRGLLSRRAAHDGPVDHPPLHPLPRLSRKIPDIAALRKISVSFLPLCQVTGQLWGWQSPAGAQQMGRALTLFYFCTGECRTLNKFGWKVTAGRTSSQGERMEAIQLNPRALNLHHRPHAGGAPEKAENPSA